MKRTAMCTMILTVALLAMASLATAGVPLEWTYQGHLTDDVGNPIDGVVDMVFRIYNDSIGGSILWQETHSGVGVGSGRFSVRLGSNIPIEDSIFSWSDCPPFCDRYLAVDVDGEMIEPRTKLNSTPFANVTPRVFGDVQSRPGGILFRPHPDDDEPWDPPFVDIDGDTIPDIPYHPDTPLVRLDPAGLKLVAWDDMGRFIIEDSLGEDTSVFIDRHGMMIELPPGGLKQNGEDGIKIRWKGDCPPYCEYTVIKPGGLITSVDDIKIWELTSKYFDYYIEFDPDNPLAPFDEPIVIIGPIDTFPIPIDPPDTVPIYYLDNNGLILSPLADEMGNPGGLAILDHETLDTGVFLNQNGLAIDVGDLTYFCNAEGMFLLDVTYKAIDTSAYFTKTGIKMSDGATDGYVMTCDAEGVGTWQVAGSGSGCWECPSTCNYTYLTEIDDSVGIGTENPAEKLQVTGNIYVTGKARIGTAHDNSGNYAFVAGFGHTATGSYSSVTGGLGNDANAAYSHVSGGGHNLASGGFSNVSGGDANAATGHWANVGGGQFDTASGDYATISGGERNTASGPQTTVGGGGYNTATGDNSVVAGGWDNDATGWRSAVLGGVWNTASATWSSVGGGANNLAGNNDATVSGGAYNTASGWGSTISGGDENLASGTQSVVGGGARDTAYGELSVISGGQNNVALALACAIPGGRYNRIDTAADYSLAFGWGVCLDDRFQVGFFDNDSSGRVGINRDGCLNGINYPLHIGTNGTNGNGAHLTTGGTWTNGSSREFKENFQPLDGKQLLEKVSEMPIESWNYKGTDELHIGPVAEDFVGAFDVGAIREDDGLRENHYLAAGDVAGVALIGVQELTKENVELRQRIEQLESMVQALLAQTNGGSDKLASSK